MKNRKIVRKGERGNNEGNLKKKHKKKKDRKHCDINSASKRN